MAGSGRAIDLQEHLRELIGPSVAEQGVELVQISLRGGRGRRVIRLDIDRPGPAGIGIADCEAVSRAVSEVLDREDPIPDRYTLEVSSPGADRPIRSEDDYRRNRGRRVTVETREPREEGRSFKGTLLGVDGGRLRLRDDDGREIEIPLSEVATTRQEIGF